MRTEFVITAHFKQTSLNIFFLNTYLDMLTALLLFKLEPYFDQLFREMIYTVV